MSWPSGSMMFFSITDHLPLLFFGILCAQLAVTVCCRCYTRSKKALSHHKIHLERSLRPIQANQVTPGPFWTRKKTRSLLDIKNGNLFSMEGASRFTKPLKQVWPKTSKISLLRTDLPPYIRDWVIPKFGSHIFNHFFEVSQAYQTWEVTCLPLSSAFLPVVQCLYGCGGSIYRGCSEDRWMLDH